MSFVVRLLREELQLLQEQGSYVGEVVRVMDKKKVLVKVCRLSIAVNIIFLRKKKVTLTFKHVFIAVRCIQKGNLLWTWTKTLT